jgi:hypothetical protein
MTVGPPPPARTCPHFSISATTQNHILRSLEAVSRRAAGPEGTDETPCQPLKCILPRFGALPGILRCYSNSFRHAHYLVGFHLKDEVAKSCPIMGGRTQPPDAVRHHQIICDFSALSFGPLGCHRFRKVKTEEHLLLAESPQPRRFRPAPGYRKQKRHTKTTNEKGWHDPSRARWGCFLPDLTRLASDPSAPARGGMYSRAS